MIVKGEPASGKTTFVKKVCSEWSTLHNSAEPVCSEIKDVLGQYDLLIPVILRLVKHGASLEDTIRDQIELDEKKMLILKWMLKKTGRTVLVFDGLDEYNINRSSDITNVMNGNTFKHVIITSRAEAINKTQEWKQIMYKEAELKGFSDEHIKLYVEKFFKTSKEQEISLIAHIFKKDSNLLELARNPGSLCMLCILHNDHIPIHIMTREQLYEEYVAFLLSRWEQRQNTERKKTPRSDILKKYHKILLKFGELANSDTNSDSADEKDYKELSFTLDQINSIVGEDAFNYGYLYKSHPSSCLVSSRYAFIHKTLHEFFLAYYIKHHNQNLESFKQRIYKKSDLLKQELSLTRFLLHLYMSPKEAFEFTRNIIGSKPDKDLFIVLLKLYIGYQHDEYQTTLTFNTTEYGTEYCYIYQYPCYVIHTYRRHEDSLSSFNKDMIRRINTDNKHKAVTVPLLQTASKQTVTCGDPGLLYNCHFCVYCRADYEVTVTGDGSKLKELYLRGIEKMGDINLNPVNDSLKVDIYDTNLHGCVGLTKPWMALIQSLKMWKCKLEAGNISVIADSIQACVSPTGAESVSPCRLQTLNLGGNSLTGAGADIARIIALCTEIDLTKCKIEAGDMSAVADGIQACNSPTGAESASPCRFQKLNLSSNILSGAGADIARIIPCIPMCTEIDLSECKLKAGDISPIADSIQACNSPTGSKSASPCKLQKLDLGYNSLTGAGADIARIISCTTLCTWIGLGWCVLNDEDFYAVVNAIIQTHSDRHTSVHGHSTPDRRQTRRIEPAHPGQASHTEKLWLHHNKFSNVETVRLLCDNLPPSLLVLDLSNNEFNEEEREEIRRTYEDKHPHVILTIKQ